MKKMTKKEFASYPKYILQIDWMTRFRVDNELPNFNYKTIDANDAFEAIAEAEAFINDMEVDSIYMVTMFTKTETILNNEWCNEVIYKAKMSCRNIYVCEEVETAHSWHIHDGAHCESDSYNIAISRNGNGKHSARFVGREED